MAAREYPDFLSLNKIIRAHWAANGLSFSLCLWIYTCSSFQRCLRFSRQAGVGGKNLAPDILQISLQLNIIRYDWYRLKGVSSNIFLLRFLVYTEMWNEADGGDGKAFSIREPYSKYNDCN